MSRTCSLARLAPVALCLAGCTGQALKVAPADAAQDQILGGEVSTFPALDTGADVDLYPACGPSPITITYDCQAGCTACVSCQVADGIASAPCVFRGGWLVLDCSQCWVLP